MTIEEIIENDLKLDFRTHSFFDDFDGCLGNQSSLFLHEFSKMNKFYLDKYFNSIQENCRAILEIGVHRNDRDSSTYTFLNNKKNETFYFGVDIEDKSFLNNTKKNIFTLKIDSSKIDKIMSFVKSKGVEKFDFIFIDGDHSINQLLRDWRFTEFLSADGIVALHDTNCHAGPFLFVEHLNTDKWKLNKLCSQSCLSDWGISFITRNK